MSKLSRRHRIRGEDGQVSTDLFGAYLERIGRYPLLTAQEEVSLGRRIEVGLFAGERLLHGDPDTAGELAWLARDGTRAKAQFIESNLRLVVSIAKHYAGRGTMIMDLVQDGNIGLVHAVEKYDYATGYKFSTYATWWIRQAIHRGIATKARLIRLPTHTLEKLNALKRLRQELTLTLHRDPNLDELAHHSAVTVAEVVRILELDYEPISLQTSCGDGTMELGELLVDSDSCQPDEYAELAFRTTDIADHLDRLSERDRRILISRFGLDGREPATLEQVALALGVSRERIRQLEKRALTQLQTPHLKHHLHD
ncbi:sigma-70 family RNA polymerase sigma factor [Cryobacterium sp. GrIS_2_6]|uniref:sigma-70 family RNA polymerase sigma factor n=1 Tax=Cryobacterium sp. GrIS_2_6 TaxID=3162785 RepID=UPI002DFECBAC|nr:sigma-70 family RNA polymerase sigma factor [Cryobacterium psychrotolerans]MEC5149835.1 RNA polymerase primary sigma factor [Cryobacterium psychrotolerans]